jgi:hypothetical protein
MKRGIIIGSAFAVFLCLSSIADAANFCATFGGAQVVATGLTLPAKGTCVAFNGFTANKAGVLLAGDVCRSSNGTTFLFNTFTQSQNVPDSLAGSWAASDGTGTGNECSNTGCTSFAVKVTKCGAITVPAAPVSEDASPLSITAQ